MELVTEKFKQKIAAVFYLNSRKFNRTRISRLSLASTSICEQRGGREVSEPAGGGQVLSDQVQRRYLASELPSSKTVKSSIAVRKISE